jgi:hypothetical protein
MQNPSVRDKQSLTPPAFLRPSTQLMHPYQSSNMASLLNHYGNKFRSPKSNAVVASVRHLGDAFSSQLLLPLCGDVRWTLFDKLHYFAASFPFLTRSFRSACRCLGHQLKGIFPFARIFLIVYVATAYIIVNWQCCVAGVVIMKVINMLRSVFASSPISFSDCNRVRFHVPYLTPCLSFQSMKVKFT